MRSLPEDFDAGSLVEALADGWGLEVENIEYAPVGGGSYHWVVTDVAGRRCFVTVDDLDRKPWLGETREDVFDGLRRAFQTAVALREAGLRFVIAPMLTSRGETLRRAGSRYSIALFPFVDGRPGGFGALDPADRPAVFAILAELHAATPLVDALAHTMDLDLPGRRSLESALREMDRPWSAGPFSERARRLLAGRASDLGEWLARLHRLGADLARSRGAWVVTHGEPHAGNVMRTRTGHVLIDWDTVALGPPERDLWMLVGDVTDDAAAYTAATGRALDATALRYFRLRWDLADIAAFTDLLRSPHRESEDAVAAYDNLASYLERP